MKSAVMHRAYVGIGSNLQGPVAQVRTAMTALEEIESTRVRTRSSLYRSIPVGYAEQPDFVNAVVEIETALDPHRLLERMLAIERARGRVRTIPNGPRSLDLDLLWFDGRRIADEKLILPHPRMHERGFVLVPLVEIAPSIIIAGYGLAAELLERVELRGIERIDA